MLSYTRPIQKLCFVILITVTFGLFFASSATAYVQTLTSVRINPEVLPSLKVGDKAYFSTLGFDQLGNPIFSGITYEWNISSTGTVGYIRPNTTGKVAILDLVGAGSGDLYVIARQGGTQVSRSILITTNQGPATCSGDVSGDNVVNLQDYTLLSGSFMKQRSQLSNPNIDIDNSGVVDLKDYSILVTHFMQPC
jgi:hypothetical protein